MCVCCGVVWLKFVCLVCYDRLCCALVVEFGVSVVLWSDVCQRFVTACFV